MLAVVIESVKKPGVKKNTKANSKTYCTADGKKNLDIVIFKIARSQELLTVFFVQIFCIGYTLTTVVFGILIFGYFSACF